MSHDELTALSEQLKLLGKMNFLPAATESQVKEFETTNNFNFPSKLREWFLFSDGGEFYLPAGVQLYGVAHKPIIDVNTTDKPSESYVEIGALATGDPVLCEKSSERISIYNREAGKIESDETFSDFITFLHELNTVLGIGG